MFASKLVSVPICVCVHVLCRRLINRCQCGAALTGQPAAASVTKMSEELEGELVITRTQQNEPRMKENNEEKRIIKNLGLDTSRPICHVLAHPVPPSSTKRMEREMCAAPAGDSRGILSNGGTRGAC